MFDCKLVQIADQAFLLYKNTEKAPQHVELCALKINIKSKDVYRLYTPSYKFAE